MGEIWLVDRSTPMIEAWERWFTDVPGVVVRACQDIKEVLPSVRTIVSPAQSFGVMDGGVDLAFIVRARRGAGLDHD
jgi:hypothetical protein